MNPSTFEKASARFHGHNSERTFVFTFVVDQIQKSGFLRLGVDRQELHVVELTVLMGAKEVGLQDFFLCVEFLHIIMELNFRL